MHLKHELASVTEALIEAAALVSAEYFQLPVAGKEEPEYRERVYCYELYHNWRRLWPAQSEFSLSGEVDKQGHQLIRSLAKPDFLVHVPGQMRNLLVMEVKARNASPTRLADDLKKLIAFRRAIDDPLGVHAGYFAAYLWIYGLPLGEWPGIRDHLLSPSVGPTELDPDLVACFIHESAGARPSRVTWR